jgi:hypothetical protein
MHSFGEVHQERKQKNRPAIRRPVGDRLLLPATSSQFGLTTVHLPPVGGPFRALLMLHLSYRKSDTKGIQRISP